MSKLSEKIRQAGQTRQGAIGFGALRPAAAPPSLLLVGYLPVTSSKQIAKTQGCDAFLLQAGLPPSDDALREAVASAKDAMCGLAIAAPDADLVDRANKAAFDFIAFEPDLTPAGALADKKLGLVYSLKDDLSDAHLRTLESLGLDAILLKPIALPITVRALMDVQRVALIARTPLIAPVPQTAGVEDLRVLRDAGVAGVLLDLSVSASPDALRKAIDALPPKELKRAERPEATIPPAAALGFEEEEEEEEDG